ncbi:hypothetical protein J3R30DRAFT_1034351 [Lentinula aciculospora]|uniref:S-adenosyl-L-methionine-dependent methyltransferase n=1 Tax=Lentinula aciculospora TaxID=153920 RepID=A0A9W9A2X0_9AGAR|nr:hypothetical protein J3R30DRAFT_1034351 [Lentinula aciculospora]
MLKSEQPRYYASTQYILPADQAETARLNEQHIIILKAFENRLFLAPLNLNTGDRVLESAAGSGIWAVEFAEANHVNGNEVEIECIDISSKQFPTTPGPPHVHFSIHSVTSLPLEWVNTFSYIHQRFVVLALNDSLWRSSIKELFRVLKLGGWIELVELETKRLHSNLGPCTDKLCSWVDKLYAEKGIIQDISVYLCPILEEAGFIDVHCETREVPVGGLVKQVGNGYTGEHCGKVCMAMKEFLINKGVSDFVTEKEFDELVEGAVPEWNNSKDAYVRYYTIFAQKPVFS